MHRFFRRQKAEAAGPFRGPMGPEVSRRLQGMRPERGAGIRPREKSDLKSVKKGGLYLKFQGMNFIIKLIIALKWVKVGN